MEIQLKGGRALNDPSYARIAYENKLTATTTTGAEALLIPNTWERWALADGAVTLLLQTTAASTINYIAMAAHNLFTAGTTRINIQVSTTVGSGWFTVCDQSIISNAPIFCSLDDYLNIVEVRITFTGGTSREIGVVYAGESLIMQRGLFSGHNPINLSSMTEYRNAMSDSGQFLGRRIKRKGQQSSFAWANLTDDWYREYFQPFVVSAKTTPFFIQWRPDYQPLECAFGYTTADISPSNQGGTTRMMSVNFTMRAHDE
mgnify:FL=1|tara:strand:- start:92 stop:868 length:777 start_codon:yes stop_codon:yes gene_type:complete